MNKQTSLKGLRILNTRPKLQAKELNSQISALGGISIECPLLEIEATADTWIRDLPPLNQVSQAIFISSNAANHCFTQLQSHQINWPQLIKVIAIGKSTGKSLGKFNVTAHYIPEISDSEHLLNLETLQVLNEQIVLLFKGDEGRTLIETKLLERKARVITLNVYKRSFPIINPQVIDSLWQENSVDIILLTSELSIQHLFKMFQKEMHEWLKSKTYLVISDRLAGAARSFGIKKVILSHPNQMIDALVNYSQGLNNG